MACVSPNHRRSLKVTSTASFVESLRGWVGNIDKASFQVDRFRRAEVNNRRLAATAMGSLQCSLSNLSPSSYCQNLKRAGSRATRVRIPLRVLGHLTIQGRFGVVEGIMNKWSRRLNWFPSWN